MRVGGRAATAATAAAAAAARVASAALTLALTPTLALPPNPHQDIFAANPKDNFAPDHCALIHLNEPCILENSRGRYAAIG